MSAILSSPDYDGTDIPSDVPITGSAQTLQSDAEKPSCIPVEDYTPIEDPWDDNDYTFLKSVAIDIDMAGFDFETLKWKGAGAFGDGTNNIQWSVIPALAAYMKATRDAALLAVKDGENADDVLAQLDNDRAYLISFLGADNKANPMSIFFN